MNQIIVLSAVVMLVLLFMKVPVFVSILAGASVYFIANPEVNDIIFAQRMISSNQSTTFLAVPFFAAAGALMNCTGVTRRIMDFCKTITGRMCGGLAQVNVLLSTLMGGLSGSNIADAAMEAKLLVPEMERAGYSKPFSSVLTATSAIITPLIPPGIAMILYGCIAQVSIGKMFVAGIGVGLLLCLALMILVHFLSKKRGYLPIREERLSKEELWKAAKPALLPLMLPILIIGGSRSSRRMDPVLEGLKRGYAVASVDYTLSGAAKFPTQVYELKAAVRFLREHAKRYLLDPDRIGMWGLSAGANLAMLAAFSAAAGELEDENFGGSSGVSGRIQALVALYGPTDLTISEGCHEASMESLFLGCVPRENRELAKRANPCTYVTKDAPPCFLQYGDADELVVLEHGAVIRDALQRVRTDGDWFEVVHGAGHADALFRTRENTEKIFRFLDGHLKP